MMGPHDMINTTMRAMYHAIGENPPPSVCPPSEVARGQVDLPRGDRAEICLSLDNESGGDGDGED